jgi:hypothetical protein
MQIEPQCFECEHYKGKFKCKAFNKIPNEIIIDGSFDHSKPFKGDKGVRFEEIKGSNNGKV